MKNLVCNVVMTCTDLTTAVNANRRECITLVDCVSCVWQSARTRVNFDTIHELLITTRNKLQLMVSLIRNPLLGLFLVAITRSDSQHFDSAYL